ncbi:hypothetical protein BS78_02G391600 [Paspalum vaginatum]|nr:hypothetical protein BS78_02G391600 [Paspalum vaginatum]
MAIGDDDNRAASSSSTSSHKKDASSTTTTTEYQLRTYLLLLATLVATVTYAAGLNLPGGVWPDNQPRQQQANQHPVGDPILPDTQHRRYLVFYYCNATAFTASLVVCLLLLALEEDSRGYAAVLRMVMVLDLFALMGAYAAGSCRDRFTTIYSLLLMSTVFAYIMPALVEFAFSKLLEWRGARTREGGAEESARNQRKRRKEEEDMHGVLMLLTTFAVTITYVAGLNPPGGFWVGGRRVSDPVLQDHHPARYQAFFVCNTTAFVMSLIIIMLLMDRKLTRSFSSARFLTLYALIIIALLGLVGAYAAGNSTERDNTTYVIGLGLAVLAYILLQVFLTNAIQEKARDLVLLLATLVASITYQAGLDPPGGLWQDDDQYGHKTGESILATTKPARYKVFFYSNSAAFVASLVVIIMVQSRFLVQRHTLEAAMILDLLGLICAYAAGSCRDVNTSIYVVALAGVVLVYVVIHIIMFFTLEQQKTNNGGNNSNNNKEGDGEMEKKREVLLVLVILVATLTYQAGLTPPGGFWSADDNLGHYAGYPVLLDNYPRRYRVFFYCNAASFMTSVALILLLVNPRMFGLVGAYTAGSSRRLRTSIYVLVLVIGLLAFVTMQVFIFWRKWKARKREINIVDDDDAAAAAQDSTPPTQQRQIKITTATTTTDDGDTIIPSGGNTNQAGSAGQGASSNQQNGTSGGSRNKAELRKYLMLLGILAASVTYQTGLKPPGGLWQDDDPNNGHVAGDPVLHDINKRRYLAFFYSNSTSFVASIVVIVLLLPSTLHSYHLPNRDIDTTKKVIALVIPVLAYIAAYPVYSFFRNRRRRNKSPNTIHHPQQGELKYYP